MSNRLNMNKRKEYMLLIVMLMAVCVAGSSPSSYLRRSIPDLFEEAVVEASDSTTAARGRVLQDGTCACSEGPPGNGGEEKVESIRLLAPGGPGSFFDTYRYRIRTQAYEEETGIKVQIVPIRMLPDFEREMVAD